VDFGRRSQYDLKTTHGVGSRAASVRFEALIALDRRHRRVPSAVPRHGATPLVDRLDRHALQDFAAADPAAKTTHPHHTGAAPAPVIAHVPPRPRAMPCAPVLFDIAYTHLAYPLADIDRAAGIAAPADSGDAKTNHRGGQPRRGLFGWFRGGRAAAAS